MVESNSRVRKQLYLPLYHSNLRRIGTTARVTAALESGVESDKRVGNFLNIITCLIGPGSFTEVPICLKLSMRKGQ